MADRTDRSGSAAAAVPAARVRAPRQRGLRRERLDAVLATLWDHRLGLVVAPAGSGKTTLLSQFAHRAGVPVAWYRAESGDGDATTLLAHLGRSCAASFEGVANGWATVEDAADALEQWRGTQGLIVVDDLHALHGTEAEGAVERLVELLPPSVVVLAASRRTPGFSNLSRLRVSGDLLEVTADDLRFRSWEVERLFRDVYEASLPPEETSTLTRRTEGWAAGLQLFHLATRGKPAADRRRLVAAMGTRSKLVREYLTENVLGDLPEEQRDFLVDTCVLGRLTGRLCDELLGRVDSAEVLEELERQQLFTVAMDTEGTYRYHEVLRSHLEAMLVASIGEVAARQRYQLAGALLELAVAPVDALRAYCRAEDWEAVARLLGRQGEAAVTEPGAWLDSLPAALVAEDPWLMLASARRALAAGRLGAAADAYERAAAAFGTRRGADAARSERGALRPWLTARPERVPGWSGVLRSATIRDPLVAAREAAAIGGPHGRFVEGIALLLGGRAVAARQLLLQVASDPLTGAGVGVACLAAAALTTIYGADAGAEAELAQELAEALNLPWAGRLCAGVLLVNGRAAGGPEPEPDEEAGWNGALLNLHIGLAGVVAGHAPIHELELARDGFERLGAPVCAVWAASILAFALANDARTEAMDAAEAAAAHARAIGVWGAVAFAHLAAARADGEHRAQWEARAHAVEADWSITLPVVLPTGGLDPSSGPVEPSELGVLSAPLSSAVAASSPTGAGPGAATGPVRDGAALVLRCFGGFRLELGGVPVDVGSVKPRPRAALHLLALHAPRPVHREVLVDSLWPEADAATGTRNLQVAISSLRALLEPGVARGGYTLLVREGDAYRLALPPGADADVAAFEDALSEGRVALARGDIDLAAAALGEAVDRYAGDLLPEDGPAEWVVKRREGARGEAADAAARLAEIERDRGDIRAALAACEAGLRVDRYRDSLWRLKADAQRAAGDDAAASRTEQAYQAMLDELGITAG